MTAVGNLFREFFGLDPRTDQVVPVELPTASVPEPALPPDNEPGTLWDGPTMWTTDPFFGRPGYYGLSPEGAPLDPPVLLTWVDDAPLDEDDGAGHFIISDPTLYFSHLPPSINPANPRFVPLEAQARGDGGVSVG